jgi:hypothetical protein
MSQSFADRIIAHITKREQDLAHYKRQKLLASMVDAKSFCFFAPSPGLTFGIVR